VPDIFNISLSALNAFQRAIAITGNNIANANTEGYSRQQISLAARPPTGFGNGFVGNGVDVASVTRNYSKFATAALQSNLSESGRLGAFKDYADQIDNLLGSQQTGVASALQDFFNAAADLSNDPSSISARRVFLSQAQALGARFAQTDSQLQTLGSEVNARITSDVQQINSLGQGIAKLNDQIVLESQAVGNQPPNGLLDKRDQLVSQLSQLTPVTSTADGDGAVNLFIGSGQPLVIRNRSLLLSVSRNTFDVTRAEISYTAIGGSTAVITAALHGGELGGLLDVRSQLIDPVRSQLGQIATGIATAVNAQQAAGLDQTGQLGRPIFSVSPPLVQPSAVNTGAANLAVSVSDVAELTGKDYTLSYDGSAYVLRNAKDGVIVPLSGSGAAADPFTADGISIVVSGAAATNDIFLIHPTINSAGGLHTIISDPRQIAAAAPILAAATNSNVGLGNISPGEVLDSTNPNLLTTATIQFTSASTYSINGSGSFAYASGANIDANGWRVQISGAPASGDSFQVVRNANGIGDNRNALLLAGLQNKGVLSGRTASLNDSIGALIGEVGTEARQTGLAQAAQDTVTSQAKQLRESISGVNLDEEAADLLRWQQAYQAAAQSIAIANQMFQTLMQATRP
jgi:flagellar hook-associated protein 1